VHDLEEMAMQTAPYQHGKNDLVRRTRVALLSLAIMGLLPAITGTARADAISCISGPRKTGAYDYEFRNACPAAVRFVVKSMSPPPDRKYDYVSGFMSAAPHGLANQDSYYGTAPTVVWACSANEAGCTSAKANDILRRLSGGGQAATRPKCSKYLVYSQRTRKCVPWCNLHPHETIPNAGGATCDGE
jgi:hypothetical protein